MVQMPIGRVVRTKGRFCKKVVIPRGRFDRRSFRTVSPNRNTRITIGCPKGQYNPKSKRCRVGTRAQRILKRKTAAGTCPRF